MPGSNVDGSNPSDEACGNESWFSASRLANVSTDVIDEAVSRILWPIVKYGEAHARNTRASAPPHGFIGNL